MGIDMSTDPLKSLAGELSGYMVHNIIVYRTRPPSCIVLIIACINTTHMGMRE